MCIYFSVNHYMAGYGIVIGKQNIQQSSKILYVLVETVRQKNYRQMDNNYFGHSFIDAFSIYSKKFI